MIPVTLITKDATKDTLSDTDYREIFEELRQKYSLRVLEKLLDSAYSFGTWDKYEKGLWTLTRQGKQELRRAMDIKDLPPTIAEAIADCDPDAEVYAIGDKPKNRLILASKDESLYIYANGTVSANVGRVRTVTRAMRKRLRRDMTEKQAAAWDGLTNEERDRALGL